MDLTRNLCLITLRTAEGVGPQLWTTPLGDKPESTAQRGRPHWPLADLPVTAVILNPEGKGRPGFWRKVVCPGPLLLIHRLPQLAKATAPGDTRTLKITRH